MQLPLWPLRWTVRKLPGRPLARCPAPNDANPIPGESLARLTEQDLEQHLGFDNKLRVRKLLDRRDALLADQACVLGTISGTF
jgi:hypothetical protein